MTDSISGSDRQPSLGGCCCWGSSDTIGEAARDILERRYASGEIGKEQYEQIKRDLERSKAPV